MAWPSAPADFSHSAAICSPTFERTPVSSGEALVTVTPFFASASSPSFSRALVHDDDVLRIPRVRFHVVPDELPRLGRGTGGRGGDHGGHRARGEHLRH